MIGNNYLLWEDDDFIVCTPFNPHISYSEGVQIVVKLKHEIATAWEDPILAGQAFTLASKVCKVAIDLELSPWFNIQANGNWGLLAGAQPYFHINIYGRNKTETWGQPIVLPLAPNTYHNDPMPEADRLKLGEALKTSLTI